VVGPGRFGDAGGGQQDLGGVPLAAQRAGDDLRVAQLAAGQLGPDDRGLLAAEGGQPVVVGGTERRLPVPDEGDERHPVSERRARSAREPDPAPGAPRRPTRVARGVARRPER
jgi:hypothetical protein